METTLSVKVATRIYTGKKLRTKRPLATHNSDNSSLFTNSTGCSPWIGRLLEALYPGDHFRNNPFHLLHFLERGLAPQGQTNQGVGFTTLHPKG